LTYIVAFTAIAAKKRKRFYAEGRRDTEDAEKRGEKQIPSDKVEAFGRFARDGKFS
jgi:hypothetical protein